MKRRWGGSVDAQFAAEGRWEELTREEQLARMPFHFWLENEELDRRLRWELGTWYVGRRWSMVNRALYLAAPSGPHTHTHLPDPPFSEKGETGTRAPDIT